jgi:hypothetical protein
LGLDDHLLPAIMAAMASLTVPMGLLLRQSNMSGFVIPAEAGI